MSPATSGRSTRRRSLLERAAALVLTAILAGTLVSCSAMDLGGANVFSVDQEWELGRKLAADIEKEMNVVHDPEIERLVQSLGMELVSKSAMAGREWRFHVVRSDEVNAFNIPGGHVYVHDGLIRAASDASELMSVMAHETAHGVQRHATQQYTKAYGLSVLAAMALGNEASALEELAANVAAGGTLAHYSRDAEREADQVGLRLMTAAGYDPNGMVRFFEKLLQLRQREPNRLERLFASHPLAESRIAEARAYIATLPAGGHRTDSDAFTRLKAAVR